MDEKENNTNPDLDLDPDRVSTAASPRPSVWKMPDPVFQKTSGRLPQGFEKELANARAEHAADQAQHTTPDQPEADPVVSAAPEFDPPPPPDTSSFKLILVLLGIAAMIAFIAVFSTVVYFFFLR